MKPIYFPFTYIPGSAGKALAACFGQITVYQISGEKVPEDMQNLVKGGILDIRIPMEIDGELLDKIYSSYRVWIDTHQGTEIAFLKTMAHKIPHFDENAASQIRAEIKKTAGRMPAQEKPDPLFNAGLFLHMAQEYDLQNERLFRDLMDIDAMEADFLKDLIGEEDGIQARTAAPSAIEIKDPGRYMTQERMAAWASFVLKDPRDFGLFITTSRAVVEHITDIFPEINRIYRFDTLFVGDEKDNAWVSWRREFMGYLEMMAAHSRPDGADGMAAPPQASGPKTDISLTLYRVPEKTPRECFSRFVEPQALHEDSIDTSTPFQNTLIGLIE
jgi:hypothetical protein